MRQMVTMAMTEIPFRWRIGLAAVSAAAIMVAPAHAESAPSDENGRYTLSASGDGYVRLDTRTGAISVCTGKGGWVCRVVPDERAALDEEIGRLQAEIDALKAQLANSDSTVKGKIDEVLPKADSLKSDDAAAAASPSKPAAAPEQRAPAHVRVATALETALDLAWQRLVSFVAYLHDRLSQRV